MMALLVLVASGLFLALAGWGYSRFLSRQVGEDPSRPTPAVALADGRDYVPTPTPVVFAHHFASIAGAGPIVGPVIAAIYGWLPALLWVVLGGVLIGAVHDYLAAFIATREGGVSIATVVRRIVGKDAFIAITLFVIVMLALVCAAFLNLSATALTSMIDFGRLGLPSDQTTFRVAEEGGKRLVVIGGIASMSVVCITAVAPLVGWLYIKKQVAVWKCSILAVAICGASIAVGVYRPISLKPLHWQLLLSAYVLVAAGVPVWLFLQSRDFINVHILYVGLAALVVTLLTAGLRGVSVPTDQALAPLNIDEGVRANGAFWPGMFILIACGAVSGFHSLCAGGTTCKQLTNERATRQIGYFGMLLESFLAVCVIGAIIVGAAKGNYILDVHPQKLLGLKAEPNPVLGFAMAVGEAGHLAFGAPIAVGALGGMVMLEGFLVTTLDTAVRLTRYLIEEIWRVVFGRYDVFAGHRIEGEGPAAPGVACGITPASDGRGRPAAPAVPIPTRGLARAILLLLRHYWVNSGLAVGLMLVFALSGGLKALWGTFATSNQLLAAFVLSAASLWLLRSGRRVWFAFIPAVAMLITTVASLILMLRNYLADPARNATLLAADIVIMVITAYLVYAGAREARRFLRRATANPPP